MARNEKEYKLIKLLKILISKAMNSFFVILRFQLVSVSAS